MTPFSAILKPSAGLTMSYSRLPSDRLTTHLPLLIIATGLCIALSAGGIASYSFYFGAKRFIEVNLANIVGNKKDQLTELFVSTRYDLMSVSGNPAYQRSFNQLSIGYKILSPFDRAGLRQKYTAKATVDQTSSRKLADYYGSAHDELQPTLSRFAEEHGLSDVIFVDRDGNVDYSIAKGLEYSSNVNDDILKGSRLATLFEQLAGQPAGATAMTDFQPAIGDQRPSFMAATPIFQKSSEAPEFIGVLIFKLSSVRTDAIVNQSSGFGSQGEAAIVGHDGFLRSNSRFASQHDILATRFTDAVASVDARDTAIFDTKAYRSKKMLAAAVPFDEGDLGWIVVAMESDEEVLRPVYGMIVRIIVVCLIVTLLLAIVASFIARRMARPIVDLVEQFDAALANMQHGLVMVDQRQRLILCNAAYRTMYNLPPELAVSGTPLQLIVQSAAARGMGPVRSASSATADDSEYEASWVELQDGRTLDITRDAIPSGGYVATHQDRTDAIRAQRQIKHLASHDPLTGLANRARLRARMEDVLSRMSEDSHLAVFCLDLDHFKAVNDTLGHMVGDLLLRGVTARLLVCLSKADMLSRLGGDEFVVLAHVASPDAADTLAKQMIDAIAPPFDLDGHHVAVGLSIGISLAAGDTDADMLIKNADTALYRAKAERRGTARFFEPEMNTRLQVRRRLEIALRQALANDEFELEYQPLYDARTEVIVSVEALLRWRHPERGTISPAEFIPLAEDMGLIVAIGEWVIRRACADASVLPRAVKVAVNLSPMQIKSPTIAHTIVSALEQSGLRPERLEIEITESVLLDASESTTATLHQLRALGVQIALDDFGTGYSSLSYLQSFPFDKIKIDKTFIQGIDRNAGSVAIIRAITQLAGSLAMTTTAEGVETEAQLEIVRQQGCNEIQGYLFSRPRPMTALLELMPGFQRRQSRA